MNWLDKHVFVNTAGWLQIIVYVAVFIGSCVSLATEFRARTEYRNKNAIKSTIINIVIAALSIAGILFTGYSANSDNVVLKKRNDTLKAKVDSFATASQVSFKTQSDLIIKKQRETADELLSAAQSLRREITGTDSVPVFLFAGMDGNIPQGILHNFSSRIAINVRYHIWNYDKLLGCEIINGVSGKAYTKKCVDSVLYPYPPRNIEANNETGVDLPLAKDVYKHPVSRFVCVVYFNNKVYEEQAYFKIVNNMGLQATRIIELVNNRRVKTWVHTEKPFVIQVNNWDQLFPIIVAGTKHI